MSSPVAALTSWHDNWRGLKVAVLGLGASGFSVADTLQELGAEVLVIYAAADPAREQMLQVIGAAAHCVSAPADQAAKLREFAPELVIVSPGYALKHPALVWAKQAQVPLWSDIELGWRLRDKTARIAEWVVITGTNGKTTTTQLTAHMLCAAGLRATVAGNIGTPILDVLRDPLGYDAIVVELSSFQLQHVHTIAPRASVCLNLADDHLDWHGGRAEYYRAKAKVYERTVQACVYNRADPATLRMVEDAQVQEGARALSFGLDSPPPSGFGVVEGILVDRGYHAERQREAFELLTLAELSAQGLATPHMVQNVLAASALARALGASPAEIARAVLEFQVDAHRTQVLGSWQGAEWIDDSKATNLHAAAAALSAYRNVVWILGGVFKGADVAELVAKHASRLRAAVIIGADRQAVLAAFARHAPQLPLAEVKEPAAPAAPAAPAENGDSPTFATLRGENVMRQAVRLAADFARPGDTVLLAPAAASLDQFKNYAARGEAFACAFTEMTAAKP